MKVFYHNDNDGKAAAAILCHYFLGKNMLITKEDFISVNYNAVIPSADLIGKGETVFIVDYSFTETTVNNLYEISDKSKGNVYWYDHHKSSLEVYDKIIEDKICLDVIIDMDRSGAKIIYDEYGNKATDSIIKRLNYESIYMEKVIKLVDDYDRWIHKYPESMWFNIGSTLKNTDPFSSIWYENPDSIIENGKLIKEYSDKKNSILTKENGYIININNHDCIVLNTPEASSKVFADYFDTYNFAIRYVFNGTNYSYSIYSQLEDIDCSKIAKYFNPNGGGHKGAAGFVSDKLLFLNGSKFVI